MKFPGLIPGRKINVLGPLAALGLALLPAAALAQAPVIVTQPISTTNLAGSQAVFVVGAEGDAPLSYQWERNGTPIPGATNTLLVLTNLQFTQAGSYSVTVSNLVAPTVSSNAVLSVRLPRAGDIDPSFRHWVPGTIPDLVAALPDGKFLIAGRFDGVLGALRRGIARMNSDGTPDLTFGYGMSGGTNINCLVIQPDGRILIAGSFTNFNGVPRSRVARLFPDGRLDPTFLNGLSGPNSAPSDMVLQPDGKVLIVGNFTNVNGVVRSNVARLNADGALDAGFFQGMTAASSGVSAVAVQADGQVIVGGNFTTFAGVSRGRIARLNGTDGTFDASFLSVGSGASSAVGEIQIQPDAKILIAGSFTSFNGTPRNYIARLNTDGSLDTSFLNLNSGPSAQVFRMKLRPDGKVLIGGLFSQVDGVDRNRLARLLSDGTLDSSFFNGLSGSGGITGGSTADFSTHADDKVLVCGSFFAFNNRPQIGMVRLNADGTTDTNLLTQADTMDGGIGSVTVLPDGKVSVAGTFTNMGLSRQYYVARLTTNGVPDGGFQNEMTTSIDGLSGVWTRVQPDGKILVSTAQKVTRLHANGSVDSSFSAPNANGIGLMTMILQPDGKVLIGGSFTTLGGIARTNLARLNADGTLDTNFVASANDWVQVITPQPDGKILIGGYFTMVNGTFHQGIARVNSNGTTDSSFTTQLTDASWGISDACFLIKLLPDGKMLIGGNFNYVDGVNRNFFARLDSNGSLDPAFLNGMTGPNGHPDHVFLLPDGKLLIVGNFSSVNGVSRKCIARLHADGALDTSFLNGLSGFEGSLLLGFGADVQVDGKIIVSGRFNRVNGEPYGLIVRLFGSSVEPPVLTAAGNVGDVTLSWPSYYLGWQLQSTPDLGAGANWQPMLGSTSTNSLLQPTTSPQMFYRLAAP